MLKVLKSGFYTSIQDSGRFGYRDKGIPISGSMDAVATHKVNKLLENESHAALLEITMTGPTLEFEESTFIVLGGASLAATINNVPIQNYKVYKINAGDIISYGKLEKGFRAYLGVKGGFKSDMVLGSRSLYAPITNSGCLKDKSEIPYEVCLSFDPKIQEIKPDIRWGEEVLQVYKGPEFYMLNDTQLGQLFSKQFSVAKENNRMAYQINETINGFQETILTSATIPGTVQCTPAGKIIVLMKDGQTTGGYPRILQVSEQSIAQLAQKKSGDFIQFKLC